MKIITFLFTIFVLLLTGCTKTDVPLEHQLPSTCTVYDMKQARCIDEGELVKRLAPYRVVFVGDHHAQTDLHQRVAKLISRLDRSGRHVSLANEWFTPEDNTLLKRYADGSFKGDFPRKVEWKKKAGYAFDSYASIYNAIRNAHGRLYGINLSRESRKHISNANRSVMTREEKGFYDSLDLNVAAHRQMLASFFAHCHSQREGEDAAACRERMYRVQVAWDSYMAKETAALSRKVLRNQSDLLMVFAGSMHLSHGLGINARFARLSREPFVTIEPVPTGTDRAGVGEADFLLFYAPSQQSSK
ncbi:MAG: ChaN family lipoprotein [Campylobacterota bacterium]|nr:ChaN family lipoprotein [Campylobacterota bacterium]